MSDPTEGAKATTAKAPSRTKAPSAPAESGETPPPPKTLDLTAWKAPAETTEPAKAEEKARRDRPRYPLVHWADLGGITGLALLDYWEGRSEPNAQGLTYDYAGANVKLPPTKTNPDGAIATVLTGNDTAAGSRLHSAFVEGKLDSLYLPQPKPVPVRVFNRYSDDPERAAKPYSILVIG